MNGRKDPAAGRIPADIIRRIFVLALTSLPHYTYILNIACPIAAI
jgi:hypothetical protein